MHLGETTVNNLFKTLWTRGDAVYQSWILCEDEEVELSRTETDSSHVVYGSLSEFQKTTISSWMTRRYYMRKNVCELCSTVSDTIVQHCKCFYAYDTEK